MAKHKKTTEKHPHGWKTDWNQSLRNMQYSHRAKKTDTERFYKKRHANISFVFQEMLCQWLWWCIDGEKNIIRSLAHIHSFIHSFERVNPHAQGENGIHWNFYHARHLQNNNNNKKNYFTQRQRLKIDLADADAIVSNAFNGFALRFQSMDSTGTKQQRRQNRNCTVFNTCHRCNVKIVFHSFVEWLRAFGE